VYLALLLQFPNVSLLRVLVRRAFNPDQKLKQHKSSENNQSKKMAFRKFLSIPKKPWGKDIAADAEPEVAGDEFAADDEFDYYDDDFFRRTSDMNAGKKGSGWGDSRMSEMPRSSTIAGFQQASLYFDYQMSTRDLGGNAKKSSNSTKFRGNTGAVPSGAPPHSSLAKGNHVTAIPTGSSQSRGQTWTSPVRSRLGRTSMMPTMSETIEGDEEESSSEGEEVDTRTRSLSPDAKGTNRRGQLVKRNSWTSSRRINAPPAKPTKKKGAEKKTKKKKGKTSGTGTKKKKATVARARSSSPKRKGENTAASPKKTDRRTGMARNNSWTSSRRIDAEASPNPGKLVKTNSWTSSQSINAPPAKPKKKEGAGKKTKKKKGKTSGTGTKKKEATVARAHSSSPKRKGEKTAASPKKIERRTGMARNNSWTSSRDIVAESSPNPGNISLGVGFAIDEEPSKKKKASGKKGTKTAGEGTTGKKKTPGSDSAGKEEKKKKAVATSEAELLSVISPKTQSKARGNTSNQLMQGLKRSKDLFTSVRHLTKKSSFNRDEMDQLQLQLSEALEQVTQLSEGQEQSKDHITKATSEVDELKSLLFESAKENNELLGRLELAESAMGEGQDATGELKKAVKELAEEKQALANDLNRAELENKALTSQMKRIEGRKSAIETFGVSEVTELQHAVFEKQLVIDEQAQELKAKDAELERQLIEGSGDGDDTRKIILLNAELNSMRKEHKKGQLDSSVQLAKKDAMIAAFKDKLGNAEDANEQEADAQASLRDELEISKERVREALKELEQTKSLRKKIEELENRVKEAEIVENGLQHAIDKWTDKTFEWQSKAEELGQELAITREQRAEGGDQKPTGWFAGN
jgi:hypothetical protein